MQCYPGWSPGASLTGSGQQPWCPHVFGRRAGRTPTTYRSPRPGGPKIIRAPGGCTNPWQRGATVSIRALIFPYMAGQPAISARFTLNQDRRCRWFKSPLGHTVCAGQRLTPLLLVPPWLPPQTSKRTDAFPSRHIKMLVPAWSPSGRYALASAPSAIARMTLSSTDPRHRCTRPTCWPGSSVTRPPGRATSATGGVFGGTSSRACARLPRAFGCP
jgi:hypothetical protein